jgi:hypothetical protein
MWKYAGWADLRGFDENNGFADEPPAPDRLSSRIA